jgi:hypothetical protein
MRVFITTCSMNKVPGGVHYDNYYWHWWKRVEIIERRLEILRLLQDETLKTRLEVPEEGPDFGGDEWQGLYLPALERYREGCFVDGLSEAKPNMVSWPMRNRIYFLSTLYGLVHYREPIQNYDFMNDKRVQRIWKKSSVITDALINELDVYRNDCRIIDCTVNPDYRELVDWRRLRKEGFTVWHVVPKGRTKEKRARWMSGFLAGETDANPELFEYGGKYGSIALLAELPERTDKKKKRTRKRKMNKTPGVSS